MEKIGLPDFKVTITHLGADTDYVNSDFTNLNIKRRENNYDVATLTVNNENSNFYTDHVSAFDEVKVYAKDHAETAYTQLFGGTVRQPNPSYPPAQLALLCKGYGAALEETHCNRDYGIESKNAGLFTVQDILEDIVDNMVNKSLGSADNTGWAITKTKIANLFSATGINYVNNPFRTNLEVADVICNLATAIAAGAAGCHWIVDNSKNFIVNTIGNHENPEVWPNYYNLTQADSTLIQGRDFQTYGVLNKTEEYANKVVLVTDFRRPAYDYWTEDSGGAALWGNELLTSIADSNAQYVVGSHSLLFTPNGATQGYGYFPAAANAAWNVTAWGSERTIPTLNFYMQKKSLTAATTVVYMSTNTTARKTDYFYTAFTNWTSESDDTWYHKSIPIGPYWATTDEGRQYRWSKWGDPSWSKIDSIEFVIAGAGAGGKLYIDDLHFKGKLARSAKDTSEITRVNEYQKVLISRESLDDSCIASDDTGFAGRIAYAELLRRSTMPKTITFQVSLKPKMMAGQKVHVHAEKRADGTFAIDADYRVLEVEHNINLQGATSSVTATSDLLNAFPISVPDQYAMMLENLMVNSKEAKNMRATSEVDLLIPILEKAY